MLPADPALLLHLLATVLAWPEGKLFFSSDAPDRTAVHPRLRLVMITRGSARCCLSRAGVVRTCLGRRGDMLAIFPFGHFSHESTTRSGYTMLQCILWDRYVRFLWHTSGQPTFWHHTVNPLSREGVNCTAALSFLARRDPLPPQAHCLMKALLHIVSDDLADDLAHAEAVTRAELTYRRICESIAAQYHRPINRDTIARELGLAPQHVSRLFASYHDCGVNEYLRSLRLTHAEQMLRDPELEIAHVAAACGFSSAGYFIREFRRHFGITPGRYRDGAHAPAEKR